MAIGKIIAILLLVHLVLIQTATANHIFAPKGYNSFDYDSSEIETQLITMQSNHDSDTELCSRDEQWFCFNSTTKTHQCINGHYSHIICSDSGPSLKFGFCATYSNDTGLITVSKCPYLWVKGHNVTSTGFDIQLPKKLAELNASMCGPMNRKGIVCSECIDGFGPSVTSIGYTCAECTNAWYRVPLFVLLQLGPITVFYLIVLIFQISITSPPMPCFIMYAQVVLYLVNMGIVSARIIFNDRGDFRLDMKVMFTLYGLFNLDFLYYYNILPAVCISSHIRPIHIAFLGYFSALYPILLIFLTWLCVKLHGYNFQPLVWLWRPFHRCCVKLRRGWDNKNDIIDVFATFFLLSYHKCLYQSVLLLSPQILRNFNTSVGHEIQTSIYTRTMVDLSITAGSSQHLPYAVIAGIISLLFHILPTLLLVLYPIKVFRLFLSKCRLDFIAINIFVDKIHGDYKNGLNGGRDMRSLSGLYFILRIILALSLSLHYHTEKSYDACIYGCGILLGCALMVASLKPYSKPYMNYLDTILLANYALLWPIIYSCIRLDYSTTLARVLFSLPMAILILGIILRRFSHAKFNDQDNRVPFCHDIITLLKLKAKALTKTQEQQPLIQCNQRVYTRIN